MRALCLNRNGYLAAISSCSWRYRARFRLFALSLLVSSISVCFSEHIASPFSGDCVETEEPKISGDSWELVKELGGVDILLFRDVFELHLEPEIKGLLVAVLYL